MDVTPPEGKSYFPLNSYSRVYEYDISVTGSTVLNAAFKVRSTKVLGLYGIILVTVKNTSTGKEVIRQIYVDSPVWTWYEMPLQLEPGDYNVKFRLANNLYIEGKFDRSIYMRHFMLLEPVADEHT